MYCLVIFFFFKQKTAYDLRISDWSSDVCSSDLKVFIGRLPPSSLRRRGPARTASPRPRLLGTPQLPGRTALAFGQPQDVMLPQPVAIDFARPHGVEGVLHADRADIDVAENQTDHPQSEDGVDPQCHLHSLYFEPEEGEEIGIAPGREGVSKNL